ncbi:hypothetical protein NPIL_241091 [Nephila pilipes]|uniref:Uncharacterized protein n=1 Tax=Nephila pilipes TaxID=299642 RepID=A0A8X6UK89_NEPPI|nr:hypothetical protein NPIL_241091 [Nephila pilipes]
MRKLQERDLDCSKLVYKQPFKTPTICFGPTWVVPEPELCGILYAPKERMKQITTLWEVYLVFEGFWKLVFCGDLLFREWSLKGGYEFLVFTSALYLAICVEIDLILC